MRAAANSAPRAGEGRRPRPTTAACARPVYSTGNIIANGILDASFFDAELRNYQLYNYEPLASCINYFGFLFQAGLLRRFQQSKMVLSLLIFFRDRFYIWFQLNHD